MIDSARGTIWLSEAGNIASPGTTQHHCRFRHRGQCYRIGMRQRRRWVTGDGVLLLQKAPADNGWRRAPEIADDGALIRLAHQGPAWQS